MVTKKQQKALAFRQRKGKERTELLDVPEGDTLDDVEDPPQPPPPPKATGKRKRDIGTVELKEDTVEATPAPTPPAKKRKLADAVDSKSKASARFILFVGNLQYRTTKEQIAQHFKSCNPPPDIRLLTPKALPGKTATTKSKGCAFLEFSTHAALQQGLKLHHSELDSRKINVELTAGGGGKSDKRLEKVRQRNKGLATERKHRVQKTAKAKPDEDVAQARPQRHSTTSGEEHVVKAKKTWAVSDAEPAGRGGANRKRGKKSKAFGTGANAIAVE